MCEILICIGIVILTIIGCWISYSGSHDEYDDDMGKLWWKQHVDDVSRQYYDTIIHHTEGHDFVFCTFTNTSWASYDKVRHDMAEAGKFFVFEIETPIEYRDKYHLRLLENIYALLTYSSVRKFIIKNDIEDLKNKRYLVFYSSVKN
jgi:hypothetical protein